MSVNDYIQSVKEANAEVFDATEVKITSKALEKHLRQAFEAGFKNGEIQATSLKSIFERVFGK